MEGKNKLYVGNLDYNLTSKDLVEIFSKFGHVLEAMVISNKHTGRSKGFGFVTFETVESAEHAKSIEGQEIAGRNIIIQDAKPKDD